MPDLLADRPASRARHQVRASRALPVPTTEPAAMTEEKKTMAAFESESRLRPSEVSFNVVGNPVSQNRAWRIITIPQKGGPGHASLKLSEEGVNFKAEIARLAALVRPRDWDRENEYVVDVVYYFDSRRPDCDGPGKLVLDALGDFEMAIGRNRTVTFVGLYKNDRQVWKFSQQKERDVANPRCEITIRLRRPWTPQQAALL
jgi:Holliday junction resolvase RusA-like endonuclease